MYIFYKIIRVQCRKKLKDKLHRIHWYLYRYIIICGINLYIYIYRYIIYCIILLYGNNNGELHSILFRMYIALYLPNDLSHKDGRLAGAVKLPLTRDEKETDTCLWARLIYTAVSCIILCNR